METIDDDVAARTAEFIDKQTKAGKPMFVAPRAYREKYRGKFDAGWDRYREETFSRQKQLGVIPANAKLTPRPQELPAWDDQPEAAQGNRIKQWLECSVISAYRHRRWRPTSVDS